MPTLFFNFYPIENVSFLDLYLLFFCVKNIRRLGVISSKSLTKCIILIMGFVVCGIFSFNQLHFGMSEYLMNVLRVLFYCVVFVIISKSIERGDYRLIKNVKPSIKVLAALVLIEQCLQFVGIYWSYNVDWLTTNTVQPVSAFRPSGPFDEPSYLAIYLVLMYYIFLRLNLFDRYLRQIIIGLLILSRSFTGLMAIPLLLFAEFRIGNISRNQKQVLVFVGSLLFATGSLMLYERIGSILASADGSVIHRFNGSIELITVLLKEKLLTGVGLGQFKNWLNSAELDLESFFFLKGYSFRSGVNNVLLLNLGYSGIFGVLSTIFFGFSIRKDLIFQLILFWLYFSWGFFFHPLVFLFFAVIDGKENQLVTKVLK